MMFSLSFVGGPNPRRGVQICERIWTGGVHIRWRIWTGGSESRELHCCSRCALDKIFEIYTFDRRGGLAKNNFFFPRQKRELENN